MYLGRIEASWIMRERTVYRGGLRVLRFGTHEMSTLSNIHMSEDNAYINACGGMVARRI